MHSPRREEVRSGRRNQHDAFPEKRWQWRRDGQDDDGQEEEIPNSLQGPWLFRPGLQEWRLRVVTPINEIKHHQQKRHADQPHRPAMPRDPPEWNTFQESDQQRRIAHWRQASAHVRHNENEKNNVMRRDAGSVEIQPRSHQQHGRARRAEEVRGQAAQRQEKRIAPRRSHSTRAQMDAAANDVKRPYQRDKSGKILRRMLDRVPGPRRQNKDVVTDRDRRETQRQFGIMLFPPLWPVQRKNCHAGQ